MPKSITEKKPKRRYARYHAINTWEVIVGSKVIFRDHDKRNAKLILNAHLRGKTCYNITLKKITEIRYTLLGGE